jgi:hypothetical protein
MMWPISGREFIHGDGFEEVIGIREASAGSAATTGEVRITGWTPAYSDALQDRC